MEDKENAMSLSDNDITKIVRGMYPDLYMFGLGTRCWKCHDPKTFFTCQNCRKCFHRKCALMSESFPAPVFDKPLQEVMREDEPASMMMCCECVVSEKTRFPDLENVPQFTLNSALIRIAGNIEKIFDISNIRLSKKHLEEGQQECIQMIQKSYFEIRRKANDNHFKSIEGFVCEYKQIRYNVVERFGRSSEAYEVVYHLLAVVKEVVNELMACPQCYIKRIVDVAGLKRGEVKAGKLMITEPCQIPHLLIWIKMPDFPYWPAKILDLDTQQKIAVMICFGDENKLYNIRLDSKGFYFKTFSIRCPSRVKKSSHLPASIKESLVYVKNARKAFGNVIIPELAEEFDGNMEVALRKMYPDFHFE